jgi:hypothetical protein
MRRGTDSKSAASRPASVLEERKNSGVNNVLSIERRGHMKTRTVIVAAFVGTGYLKP